VRLLLGAQEVFCYLRHKPLTPPADARFNGSVRLVYRRKNVIGIVLTEAGKGLPGGRCLLAMVRVISEICGTPARAHSAIAYKVCCTDLLSWDANVVTRD